MTPDLARPEECPACLGDALLVYPGQHATMCPMFHGHQVQPYFGSLKCACGHLSPDGSERERHLAKMARLQRKRALTYSTSKRP